MADSGDLVNEEESVKDIVKMFLLGLVDKVAENVENMRGNIEGGGGEVIGHGDWRNQSDERMKRDVEKSRQGRIGTGGCDDKNIDEDHEETLSGADKATTEDIANTEGKSITDVLLDTKDVNQRPSKYSLDQALVSATSVTASAVPPVFSQGQNEVQSETQAKVVQSKAKKGKINFWNKLNVKKKKDITDVKTVNEDLKTVACKETVVSTQKDTGDSSHIATALHKVLPVAVMVVPGDYEVKVTETESNLRIISDSTSCDMDITLKMKEKESESELVDPNADSMIGRTISKKRSLRRWVKSLFTKTTTHGEDIDILDEKSSQNDNDGVKLTDENADEGFEIISGEKQTNFGRGRFGRIFGCCRGHSED